MITGRGRPLRFVALVAAGWASARVLILWPEGATLPEAIEEAFPIQRAVAAAIAPNVTMPAPPRPAREAAAAPVAPSPLPVLAISALAPRGERGKFDLAMLGLVSFGREQPLGAPSGAIPQLPPPPVALPEAAQPPSRWAASGWFVTRRGAPAGGAMLGGDQFGARIAYALGGQRRMRLYLRATAPLAVAGRELALGIEWQPTKLPVRMAAEQRFGLDGNRGGPAVAVVGGVDAVDLPFDFKLEAYGQAGAVWRGRVDPFADGALRVTQAVARAGRTRLDVGGGVWGAAQREAARLDVGPSAVATVPLGDQAVRVAIDWRERVAGDARPGSGPALTLGADF